jgi:hypothetical protein
VRDGFGTITSVSADRVVMDWRKNGARKWAMLHLSTVGH